MSGSTTPSRAASLLMWRQAPHRGRDIDRNDRTMKLRHTVADRVAGFVRDWSLPRQFAGEDPTREAAKHDVRRLRPRLEEADTIGTSICPYCAVGCAQLVYAKDGQVIHIEGDPRSPINQGTLCPKGAATFGWLTSPDRLTKVLYRAPHAESWEERPLGWAMDRIAYLVKRTRDETFVRDLPDRTPVNHTRWRSARSGALPSTMRKITSSRNCSAPASAWFGSRTRHASDTVPPSQVWARATEGERRRSRDGIWPMRTASS